MERKDIITNLIEIKGKIAALELQEKQLQKELLADKDFNSFQEGTTKVSRLQRRTVALADGVSDEQIMDSFPDCAETVTKIVVDMKKLENKPEAHDLLVIKQTEFITVKEVKEKEKMQDVVNSDW